MVQFDKSDRPYASGLFLSSTLSRAARASRMRRSTISTAMAADLLLWQITHTAIRFHLFTGFTYPKSCNGRMDTLSQTGLAEGRMFVGRGSIVVSGLRTISQVPGAAQKGKIRHPPSNSHKKYRISVAVGGRARILQ